MPETKSVPLESMNRLFSRELPARKAHKIVMGEIAEAEAALRVDLEEKDGEKSSHIEKMV